jgi:hypothetical protein
VLNEAWIRQHVDNPSSGLYRLLEANSLVGGWKPKVPVLMAHDPGDTTVRSSGTRAMFDDWKKAGANPIGIIDLAVGQTGTGHVGGALVAVPAAFIWIGAGMPRNLQDMAQGKIREAMTAWGMHDKNPNRSLFPLSRIDCPAPYTLSYGDLSLKVGKLKVYTLEKSPVFEGQTRAWGLNGYTRLVKELKEKQDSLQLQPNVTYYLAVYPDTGGVALTLKFQGKGGVFTTNIKQVKNKVVGATQAYFTVSSNFKTRVHSGLYEHGEKGEPFIALP